MIHPQEMGVLVEAGRHGEGTEMQGALFPGTGAELYFIASYFVGDVLQRLVQTRAVIIHNAAPPSDRRAWRGARECSLRPRRKEPGRPRLRKRLAGQSL